MKKSDKNILIVIGIVVLAVFVFNSNVIKSLTPATLYGDGGCYTESGFRNGRVTAIIYNSAGQEIYSFDPSVSGKEGSAYWHMFNLNQAGKCQVTPVVTETPVTTTPATTTPATTTPATTEIVSIVVTSPSSTTEYPPLPEDETENQQQQEDNTPYFYLAIAGIFLVGLLLFISDKNKKSSRRGRK